MRAPLWFVYGNLVFGSGPDDCWALFATELDSYEWLRGEDKHARFLSVVAALEAVEADVQILRFGAVWKAEQSARRLTAAATGAREDRFERRRALRRYVEQVARGLGEPPAVEPQLFVAVSLQATAGDVASLVSGALSDGPAHWLRAAREALVRDRRMLSASELERFRVRADGVHAMLSDHVAVRPARGVELQWLVRRGFCRGLGEPEVDGLHEPGAVVFERNGRAMLAPLEADVMRWTDSEIEHRARVLRVESELGTSWQAQLVLGALPDRVQFPGHRAELLFAPPEALPFGLDISLVARFVPNDRALRIARRKIQDADQIFRAEAGGEQGASDLGYERTQEARDLLGYLQAPGRPPLFRTTIVLAVGAADEQELEARVRAVRRAYGEVRLHRPLGEQLRLFLQHLPGQRGGVPGFQEILTAEQIAAMMPTATHRVGARRGIYLGRTASGSRRPVLFNLAEGSQADGNTTVLSVGALGSGKTTLAQKLQYEGFLQGARVVDCDPKGDHRFHLLEDVAPHVEEVTLRPHPSLRGMLDPLRVAPAHLRHDATVSFLRDLLPGSAEPGWETAIVASVDRVTRRASSPSCLDVVRALLEGDETERRVGRALEVYARSGLTQLGFADPSVARPEVGRRQVTYLSIRDLPGPAPGASRGEYSLAERVGEQIVRLIAMFALDLLGAERERLKIFSFDEGWRLLSDPTGRLLLASLQRMGRSELAVPIISTQLIGDALVGQRDSFESLLGATFVFGVRSHREASRALELLGLDPDDRVRADRLLAFQAGRCLFRDHRGRIEEVQVELVAPRLRRAFSTTPGH